MKNTITFKGVAAKSATGIITPNLSKRTDAPMRLFLCPCIFMGANKFLYGFCAELPSGRPIAYLSVVINSVQRPPLSDYHQSGGLITSASKGTVMSTELSATFDGTEINILDHNGDQCLTSSEVAKALGYKFDNSVTKIYERNKEEFDDTMTLKVKLTIKGQKQTTRIFSKRGCHLIGMFAKTPKAKAFRKWVLDTLENGEGHSQAALPNHQALALPSGKKYFLVEMTNGHMSNQTELTEENLNEFILENHPDWLLINRQKLQQTCDEIVESTYKHAGMVALKLNPLQMLAIDNDPEIAAKKREQLVFNKLEAVIETRRRDRY